MSVSDPDNDPLTVSWAITRGSLQQQNAARTLMRWSVPATVGVDTVVVSVTDGSLTRRVTEVIKVGWPASVVPATFLRSQSPYIVSVDAGTLRLDVQENQQVVIEAGTELLLDTPGTVIAVAGQLLSQGAADEPVIIHPNVRGQQCGDERGWWDGIRAERAAGASFPGDVQLEHTEVWYAQNAVRLINDATATIHDSAIRCSGAAGVLHEGSGALEIADTEISNGRVHGVVIGGDVGTQLPDSVRIERCDIEFNESAGLRFSIDDPGLSVPMVVEYNRIEFNFLRGMTLARASFPAVHFNQFSGNGVGQGLTNIYLEDGYPGTANVDTLRATCNYFGTNSQTVIDATIRDSLDNPGLVGTRVITDPWLTASPITTPPSCTP